MSRVSSRGLLICCAAALALPIVTACGHDTADAGGSDAGADAAPTTDAGPSAQLTETALDVTLALVVDPTGVAAPALHITTHDGTTPVRTDLWLYTLVGGQLQELDAFTATTNRKTGRLMIPATLGGAPSGLVPADDGRQNGLMTDGFRGTLLQGALISTIDGTVVVSLAALPTDPIVVVAGIEDERYAGAAAILPDGTPGTVPAGVGVPETHVRVSYQRDVAPILQRSCIIGCHNPKGPLTAPIYVMDTQDHLVNNNFGQSEQIRDCQTAHSSEPIALAECIRDITAAEFLVEPGAPALSGLVVRSRPDEALGASALGLAWFGGGSPKSRYNATYGDRRMPSTTTSTAAIDWTNAPTELDMAPASYQILFDWVAQGAEP